MTEDAFDLALESFTTYNMAADQTFQDPKTELIKDALRELDWSTSFDRHSNFSYNHTLLKRKSVRSRKNLQSPPSSKKMFVEQKQKVEKYKINEFNISQVGEQLKRLQKGLSYTKSKANLNSSKINREKKFIRRLQINKENIIQDAETSNLLTGRQLQELELQNGELYILYLNLYRFYENAAEQSTNLKVEIENSESKLQKEEAELLQLSKQLQQLQRLQEEEEIKDNIKLRGVFSNMKSQYYMEMKWRQQNDK